MSALYTVTHGAYADGYNLRYLCLHENVDPWFMKVSMYPNGWAACYHNLPPVDKSVYVYLWDEDDWCFPEDLEATLQYGKCDDFRKVCFGEPDYPIELYW